VPIDYGRLRNVTAREIISALNSDGFAWDCGDGSHQIYYNPDGRRVTVVMHGTREDVHAEDAQEHDRERSPLDEGRSPTAETHPITQKCFKGTGRGAAALAGARDRIFLYYNGRSGESNFHEPDV
jgi:predicted RNA binding protein YcfA (HicA-like mRNA interferase family)